VIAKYVELRCPWGFLDCAPVSVRTKVIEVDPRIREAEVRGIAERPRRIAEAILSAIQASNFNNG